MSDTGTCGGKGGTWIIPSFRPKNDPGGKGLTSGFGPAGASVRPSKNVDVLLWAFYGQPRAVRGPRRDGQKQTAFESSRVPGGSGRVRCGGKTGVGGLVGQDLGRGPGWQNINRAFGKAWFPHPEAARQTRLERSGRILAGRPIPGRGVAGGEPLLTPPVMLLRLARGPNSGPVGWRSHSRGTGRRFPAVGRM